MLEVTHHKELLPRMLGRSLDRCKRGLKVNLTRGLAKCNLGLIIFKVRCRRGLIRKVRPAITLGRSLVRCKRGLKLSLSRGLCRCRPDRLLRIRMRRCRLGLMHKARPGSMLGRSLARCKRGLKLSLSRDPQSR
jgi:hypothetical protein